MPWCVRTDLVFKCYRIISKFYASLQCFFFLETLFFVFRIHFLTNPPIVAHGHLESVTFRYLEKGKRLTQDEIRLDEFYDCMNDIQQWSVCTINSINSSLFRESINNRMNFWIFKYDQNSIRFNTNVA